MNRAARALRHRTLGILGPLLRPVAERTALAAGLGLTLAISGARYEGVGTDRDVVDTSTAWIRLPMFLVVLTAVLTTIDAWPGFGQDRGAAAGFVRRARLWPTRGTTIAATAGLSTAILALCGTGFLFDVLARTRAPRAIHAVHVLCHPGPRVLGMQSAGAAFDVPEAIVGQPATTLEIRARPGFVPGREVATPTITVRCNEEDVGMVTFAPGGGVGRILLPQGWQAPVRLRIEPGQRGLLVLGPAALQLVRESDRSPRINAILAALSAAWPAGAALGLAVLLHAVVGRVTLLVAAMGVVLLGFASDISGVPGALTAYARAQEVTPTPFPATRAPDRAPG